MRRETILTSGVNLVDVSDPFSALFFLSEDFQFPNTVLTDTFSPSVSRQQRSFLPLLGPHPH